MSSLARPILNIVLLLKTFQIHYYECYELIPGSQEEMKIKIVGSVYKSTNYN